MSRRWIPERHQVVLAAQEMYNLGLVTGTAGNISVRLPPLDGSRDLMAITPAGKHYDTLRDEDIVVTDFEVEPVEGDLAPSAESLLHVTIYQARPDSQAVVHTHSVYSSVLAVAGLEIPPIIDEMMLIIGGPVGVSRYGFPGSQELADNVTAVLGDRNGALIRNHGAVGVGRDLREALDACALVERVSHVYIYASLLGKVSTPPPEAIEAELAIFRMRRKDLAE